MRTGTLFDPNLVDLPSTSRNPYPGTPIQEEVERTHVFKGTKTCPTSRQRQMRDPSRGPIKFIDIPSTLENIDPRVPGRRYDPTGRRGS